MKQLPCSQTQCLKSSCSVPFTPRSNSRHWGSGIRSVISHSLNLSLLHILATSDSLVSPGGLISHKLPLTDSVMEDSDDESTPPRSDGSLNQPPSRNMRPPEGWYASLDHGGKTDYNRLTTAVTKAGYFGTDLDMKEAEEGLKKLWEKKWTEPHPQSPRHVFHPSRGSKKPQTNEGQPDSQSGQQSESSEKGHTAADCSVAVTKIGGSEQDSTTGGTCSKTA